MRRLALLFLAVLLASSSPLWGRGGGGCLLPGTRVETPDGPRAIEELRPGDRVVSVVAGRPVEARVQACTLVHAESYIRIHAGGRVVRATAEHPFRVGDGVYKIAGELKPGDSVMVLEDGRLKPCAVDRVQTLAEPTTAYNLTVWPGGSFVAEGLVVHNKGCFLPDTPIVRADGVTTAISHLKPGDALLAFTADGKTVVSRVNSILTAEVDEYLQVTLPLVVLNVTPDHPFYVGRGVFRSAESLTAGQEVYAYDGAGLSVQKVVGVRRVAQRATVYNLQTDRPNTFFAGGIAVHNKGGCFPAGTSIAIPGGATNIEGIRAGDVILAVGADGRSRSAVVRSVFVTINTLLRIATESVSLDVSATHPLRLIDGTFRPAGEISPGDVLCRVVDGAIQPAEVRGVQYLGGQHAVYNLQVDDPHTFIAQGLIVHNKGGGGGFHGGGHSYGGGSHGSSGGGDSVVPIIFGIGIVLVIVFVIVFRKKGKEEEDLDYCFPASQVAPKARKTEKLLEFISKVDGLWTVEALRQHATDVFLKLQTCWEARDYQPMTGLMMGDLYAQHMAQLSAMTNSHEINRIEGAAVESAEIVNVRYTEKADQREFTALMTAKARDYYVDDRDNSFLRGDRQPARFQEFWTFQLQGAAFLLREIEQSRESSVLTEDNFFEAFHDSMVDQIYGKDAKAQGQAGPWQDEQEETKASRIERLLAFLVQTEKRWDRAAMIKRARQVFLAVYLCRQGAPEFPVPVADLYGDLAEALQAEIAAQAARGLSVEFRNLCVRKADLVLVRNYRDTAKDEFVVHISAHAQRVQTRGGQIIYQEDYVRPFDEYWTFGFRDGQWKLKEILPPGDAQGAVGQENVDEGSSASQLQWFYRQKRAI